MTGPLDTASRDRVDVHAAQPGESVPGAPAPGEAVRLAELLDAVSLGVLVESGHRRIVLANQCLTTMLRLPVRPDDLVGASLTDPVAGLPPVGEPLLARLAAPVRPEAEELDLPDGRVVECTSSPIRLGESPEPPGRLWVFRDVTAAAADRRALREHNRRLSALSALKTEFIAIVSHELRTPLTSIAAFTEMLADGEVTTDEVPGAVAAIGRNTDRMLILVQDLIQLAQLESGEVVVAGAPVDIAELTREAAQAVAARQAASGFGAGGASAGAGGPAASVEAASVAVRARVADGPLIPGDAPLLRQLLHTLVGTVASCADADTVTLTASTDETAWTITASTPAEDDLSEGHLLTTALPVPGEEPRQRSAALSILLARSIAASHGGTLETALRADGVARVTVRLPLSGSRSADRPH